MPRAAPSGHETRIFALNGDRIAIGSAPGNDLFIADSSVSRQHALLERTTDSYRLSDRGSTNGTYVNGRRITAAVLVGDGDEVRFGARGYRLVRDTHQPVASHRRRGRAAAAIAAAALLALGAFAITQRALRS
ncbi:MAG: FHA domain-containing protein, partial [Candidatus Binataceae bacterium]